MLSVTTKLPTEGEILEENKPIGDHVLSSTHYRMDRSVWFPPTLTFSAWHLLDYHSSRSGKSKDLLLIRYPALAMIALQLDPIYNLLEEIAASATPTRLPSYRLCLVLGLLKSGRQLYCVLVFLSHAANQAPVQFTMIWIWELIEKYHFGDLIMKMYWVK